LENISNGGYVRAKLEDIEKKIDRMDVKMDKLDDCVDGMRLKVAWLAGTISLIVSVLVIIVKNIVER
jgi:hypothetical protein